MSVSDLYISTISQLILLQENTGTDPGMAGKIQIAHGMWKLVLRPRNSFSGNSYMGFSLKCVAH